MVQSSLLELKVYGKNILVCREEKEDNIGTMKESTAKATVEVATEEPMEEVMIEVIEQDMEKEAYAVASTKAIPSELGGSSQ